MIRTGICAIAISLSIAVTTPGATHEVEHTYDKPTASEIAGEGGIPLVVQEWGNPNGFPILLLHGMGFSSVVFKHQTGELSKRARIVAFDMRGHGLSGKPWNEDAYSGWEIWAKDVAAVIAERNLQRPLIVGWSFGGYVAIDYLRFCGSDCARGLVLASSLAGLVENPPQPDPTEFGLPDRAGDVRSNNYHELFEGIAWTSRVMTAEPPSAAAMRLKELSMAMSPPYAKNAMQKVWLKNDDLAGELDLPVLIIHGAIDGTVTRDKVEDLEALLPQARSIEYETSGHMPFMEEPQRFNRDLLQFIAELDRKKSG